MSFMFATRLFHEFYMTKNKQGAPLFNETQYKPRQTSITWSIDKNEIFYYDANRVKLFSDSSISSYNTSSSDQTLYARHSIIIDTDNPTIFLEAESESDSDNDSQEKEKIEV